MWQKLLNATRALPYYLRLDAAQASTHPPSLLRTEVTTTAKTWAEQHPLWACLCAAGMRAGDVDPPAAPPATASGRSGALEQVLTLHPSTFPEELYSRTQRRCARALMLFPHAPPMRLRCWALCRARGASGRPAVTAY